jgi:hypothetical protein
MSSIERIKFNKWLSEKYPDTYAIMDKDGINVWVDFAYHCWLGAKNQALDEIKEQTK